MGIMGIVVVHKEPHLTTGKKVDKVPKMSSWSLNGIGTNRARPHLYGSLMWGEPKGRPRNEAYKWERARLGHCQNVMVESGSRRVEAAHCAVFLFGYMPRLTRGPMPRVMFHTATHGWTRHLAALHRRATRLRGMRRLAGTQRSHRQAS